MLPALARLVIFGALVFCVLPASADPSRRVFIIANQPDGYGIDQCLASGDRCGAHAARAYCQSRDFGKATAYRRVEPDEVTGGISPASTACMGSGCGEFIAITCER